MNTHVNLGFLFFLVTIIIYLASAKAKSCSKEETNKNDADIARLMSIGQYGRPFPIDYNQLSSYCK